MNATPTAAPPPTGDELPPWLRPRVPAGFKPLATPARFCCIMQKGGSGKSTTAVCLACELALMGLRVRVWDVDAQLGGTTHWLAPKIGEGAGEPANLLHLFNGEASPDEVTYPTQVPNLYVVPSYTSLKQVEIQPPPGAEQVIDWAIEHTAEPFDVEITDCGPALGQLSVAALVGTPNVIIPLKVSGFDLNALTELNRTLRLTKQRLAPDLKISAVLLSEVLRSNLTRDVFDAMCADFPDSLVMGIRQSVKAREASLDGIRLPLHEYAPDATVRHDFRYLAAALVDAERKAA
ncbi:ParA family protein [Planotetraspora phitsanulokensis]|uniref:Partitioning protein para n=1 Tax=Planotetraspora phitsanulokensis TaxID=575192 RepID=A0A8J3UDN4_9ACTN|nr:ParA family protein [Planotetraspora phitsanulokensis]GII42865.1 partitioning protein para [Planotetraspora phitsanulokensis]